MKRSIILLFILCALKLTVYAQKDLPVCGHASTLIDLLKKDYNSVDPDSRQDEMSRDVTLVISVFKSYLSEDGRKKLASGITAAMTSDREQKYQNWNLLKKQVSAYTTMASGSLSNAGESLTASENLKVLSKKLETGKQEYFKAKYDIDVWELKAVSKAFSNEHNQFLAYVIRQFLEKYNAVQPGMEDKFSTSNPNSEIQKSIPFIGGDLAFETAMDGLAKFLAKRIKEEMTTYVMERVKKWLQNPGQDDQLAEFKVILPRTTEFLVGFSADKITNFPNEIKQYINDDLDHLLDNAQSLRSTPRIQRLLSNRPDLDFAFDALETVPNISKMKTPQDYFSMLEKSRGLGNWKNDSVEMKHNIANAILFTSMLAHSLAVNDNGEQKLASVSFFTAYSREPDFFVLYAGFLRQQNRKYYNITFNHGTNTDLALDDALSMLVEKDPGKFQQLTIYQELVDDMLTTAAKDAEKIYNVGQDIKKANQAGKKIAADTIFTFVDNILSFSENLVKASDNLNTRLITDYNTLLGTNLQPLALGQKTAGYFAMANASNQIIRDISNKKIADALLKTMNLTSTLAAQGQLGNLSRALQQLRSVGITATSQSWFHVIEFTVKNSTAKGTLHLDAKLLADLRKVNAELAKLDLYCQIKNPQGVFHPLLINIKAVCSAAVSSGVITAADLASLGAFVNRPDFKQLILSYATNLALDDLMIQVHREMLAFLVLDSAGAPVHVFQPADADQLTFAASQYMVAVFDNYYVKGYKDEGEGLRKVRITLFGIITNYLSLLPQRFDIASNTQLVSLIHFINDMAVAQSSDDVEKAIEAFALPSGSYDIKRQSRSNFSINSYPGIFPAVEFADGKRVKTIGFTAPVGFGLSWSTERGHVNGFFIPVIDIGALTRLRLDNSSDTPALPEFNFKNVFSPGIFYSHGFPKSPLAVNVGLQYGPQFQKLNTDGTFTPKDSFRVGAALVFDIPLFNLQTRPR